MRSLAVKLTLAFLLVGLSGAVLVTVLLQVRTRSAFNQFILNQEQQALVNQLLQYYQGHSGWEGVEQYFQSNLSLTGHSDNKRDPNRFTLVGTERTILMSANPAETGQPVTVRAMDQAITLKYNNEIIGWVILDHSQQPLISNSPEAICLESINRATLLSALVAI